MVRLNAMDGTLTDREIPEWTLHPTADVAVARITDRTRLRVKFVSISHALEPESEKREQDRSQVALGDRVYFIGRLPGITAMGRENVPMVRTGGLGRLDQPEVPIENPDGSVSLVTAHLIDCCSVAGFSGAPCFVEYDRVTIHYSDPTTLIGSKTQVEHTTTLLGLISRHFDDWAKARTTGDILGTIESRMNSGVGIVTPAHVIRETLDVEELVEVRERCNRELEAEGEDPGSPASLDSMKQDRRVVGAPRYPSRKG